MIQFMVYLKSELGKLSDCSQVEWFLRSVSSEVIQDCGLPKIATELTTRFASQDQVDAFVVSLSQDQLRSLTRTCDRDWRINHVYDKLKKPREWLEAEVAIDFIDVQQAESSLAFLFQRNGFQLTRIIQDPELAKHEPYKSSDLGRLVEFPTCMALLSNGRYRLIDGIHRAIQLARSGKQVIRVLYSLE